jgi:hypothetical protein
MSSELGRRLEALHVPGENRAAERAWSVVSAAYASREQAPSRRRPSGRHVAAVACAVLGAAAVGVAATPAGRDLVDEVRRAVGVESAGQSLASLPGPGRLLVTGDAGTWVVSPDGGRRLLGPFVAATWSPFGRYVAAIDRDRRTLVAVEPGGRVRWSLARRGRIALPRWGGTETDTRIAYLEGRALHVVPGDGTGDRLLAAPVARVAPAWRPGAPHELSYVAAGGAVVTLAADSGRVLWRARPAAGVSELAWSQDGRLLLVRARHDLVVLDARGRPRFDLLGLEGAPVAGAAFLGDGVAFVQHLGDRSVVWVVDRLAPDASVARRVFEGAGRISAPQPSPDGRRLLLPWPSADQWVVFRGDRRRVDAFSDVSRQLGSAIFPRVEGWCCASG